MRIIYLRSARSDLIWYRAYYESVFPEGARNASRQYLRAISNLAENPQIGHPLAETGLREYAIPRIPFSIIYRLTNDRIKIIRVWDQRADRSALGLHEEGQTLL